MFSDSLKRLVCPSLFNRYEVKGQADHIQNVKAELTALINDTTGTLIASNYVDPNTKIAVIFGTGCNAAYMESAENIPKMSEVGLPAGQGMAINVRTIVLY